MIRRFLNKHLSPSNPAYKAAFLGFSAAYRLGLMAANTGTEVLRTPNLNLVLQPLSGTSTLRAARHLDGCNLSATVDPDLPSALLTRDAGLRAQSFYNKKLRNADTVGKCRVLATCPPMQIDSSVESFLDWLENLPPAHRRDKHLWRETELLTHLGLDPIETPRLTLDQDTAAIETAIGHPLPQSRNTTDDVARYQTPVSFSDPQMTRARAALGSSLL
jgi:hypothetical protein